MIVLGVETSCDETAAAVVEATNLSQPLPALRILSNIVASQIETHQEWGGVVPQLAAREHTKNLSHVLEQALRTADLDPSTGAQGNNDDCIIVVTNGPGLMPCLLTGVQFARNLAGQWQKPLMGVNHMEGHLYSPLLAVENRDVQIDASDALSSGNHDNAIPGTVASNGELDVFPVVSLVVSGGHTLLVLVEEIGKHRLLGQTVDDAAGEAFDKVARMLGLGYPGGPAISREAKNGDATAFDFPRPMKHSGDYRFSFSGLKTAVLYTLRDIAQNDDNNNDDTRPDDACNLPDTIVPDVAASFEQAAVDVLVAKTMRAAKEYKAKSIWLSGGVAANRRLRHVLHDECSMMNIPLLVPPMELCTDNAAMIAAAGALQWHIRGARDERKILDADANQTIRTWK